MLPQWVIEKKRDGHALSEDDIRAFVDGYHRGDIPDYQMAAFAMAVFFRDMSFDETAVLTDAMMRSGTILDTSRLSRPTVDKHSTGGIGDKVSLILAPLVATCGAAVPMISGRGLGITGGTLDKLESIPGYRTDLDADAFLDVVAACGCAIIGQSADLAPVDKRLYALRDVTGTVPSIPLITASIMSKKLAESTDALVLDVKWGRGAFMKTQDDARRLAHTLVAVGERMGRKMAAVLTDMNQPLGRAVGNAVEVAETIACLQGDGPEDVMRITMTLGGWMLRLTGRADSAADAEAALRDALRTGQARDTFVRMIERHGGDPTIVDRPDTLPMAAVTRDVKADRGGTVASADAGDIGRAALLLGAGRRRVDDTVNHAVGITDIRKIGETVNAGDPLARIHGADETTVTQAEELVIAAFNVSSESVVPPELIFETLTEAPAA